METVQGNILIIALAEKPSLESLQECYNLIL